MSKSHSPQNQLYRYFIRREKHFEFKWHCHHEYELTLITSGNGSRMVGNDISDYRAGDLVLLGPDLPHTWYNSVHESSVENEAIVLHFSPQFFSSNFLQQPEMKLVKDLLRHSKQGLAFPANAAKLVSQMLISVEKQKGFERIQTIFKILGSMSECSDQEVLSTTIVETKIKEQRQLQIEKVFEYLQHNFLDTIQLEQAARVVHMSPSAFSRFFKRSTGKTLIEMVNEIRVSHACGMLMDSELPISRICFESGFNNLSHFNRQFLRLKGLAPKNYRKYFRH